MIVNAHGVGIKSSNEKFNEFACMHQDDFKKLLEYIIRLEKRGSCEHSKVDIASSMVRYIESCRDLSSGQQVDRCHSDARKLGQQLCNKVRRPLQMAF